MSATKQQEQLANETSWLAQLGVNAEYAGFSLEDVSAKAVERYNKPLDELTVTEAKTLAFEYSRISREKREAERAARIPVNGPHSHPCFECGCNVSCGRKDCRDTVSQCVACHEGLTVSEFNRVRPVSFGITPRRYEYPRILKSRANPDHEYAQEKFKDFQALAKQLSKFDVATLEKLIPAQA